MGVRWGTSTSVGMEAWARFWEENNDGSNPAPPLGSAEAKHATHSINATRAIVQICERVRKRAREVAVTGYRAHAFQRHPLRPSSRC